MNKNSTTQELKETTVWMVGDSTMCDFTGKDVNFYYRRYGYGTQMENYLSEKAKIRNLAISGDSSYYFLQEDNYETLKENIKEGDYLIIGFGHNDEKNLDPQNFRKVVDDIDQALNDKDSFQYNLNENYIKLATKKGATPILATPIVRANNKNDYSGSSGHVTEFGDYAKAIRDLGNKVDVDVIDLTTMTKNQYTTLGYDEAVKFHAVVSGSSNDEGVTVTPNWNSADTTHLNIYGAKNVAYQFNHALKETENPLGKYVLENIAAPSIEKDLVVNETYKWIPYKPVDWASYDPAEQFQNSTQGLYGTGFGDTGGDPASASNGYVAKETSTGVYEVGQSAALAGGKTKGKIAGSTFGFAYLFKQCSIKKNFTITADAKVLEVGPETATAPISQSGFGLMLRDDCYIPTKDSSINSNCICAGFDVASSNTNVNFCYESGKLNFSGDTCATYNKDSTASFKIERVGQNITITTIYGGTTYSKTYLDFEYITKDSDYYYLGMFATRGTLVEFTNVIITQTGDAQDA